jgi:hypothetical protein
VIGTNVTFSWNAVTDSEGGISGYRLMVGTTPGGADVFNGVLVATNQTVGGNYGQTLYARVAAINNAGMEGSFSPVAAGTILLDPVADADNDGLNNRAEIVAGTDPLNASSVLRILSLTTGNLLTWSSVSGKTYQVECATNLLADFAPLGAPVQAMLPTATYLDAAATNAARVYRVKVVP